MDGFTVDPAELLDGAKALAGLDEDLGEHSAMRWFMAPEEVGHETLAAELREFQAQLNAAMNTFRQDLQEASNGVRDTANAYQDLDTRLPGDLG